MKKLYIHEVILKKAKKKLVKIIILSFYHQHLKKIKEMSILVKSRFCKLMMKNYYLTIINQFCFNYNITVAKYHKNDVEKIFFFNFNDRKFFLNLYFLLILMNYEILATSILISIK